jgi:hypothetical protein
MSNFLKYGNAIRLAQLSADPSNPENGLMYYNTTSNVVRQYINGGWQNVASGSVALTGQALDQNRAIVGNASNLSAAVDTSSVGDILADSTNGLTIKTGVIVNADINASAGIDASKLADGSVSNAELQALDGVTSSIQTQLNGKASATNVSNLITLSGVAADSTSLGTFPGAIITDNSTIKSGLSQLEAAIEGLPSPIVYKGTYNASTNTPTLANADTGKTGFLYYVTVAGSQNFGAGAISFAVGDKVVNNGTSWDKWDNTDEVTSVFSRVGAITAQSGDYNTSQVTESGNLYFTDERAQDAVGTILTDSTTVDFTYNDAGNTITAAVLPAGVNHNLLLNYAANQHVDHSTVQIATAASTSGLTGGGTIAATRNLSVDINGTTAETVADNADALLIYDNSATALRKMTRANFLSGIAASSTGDINQTTFSGLVNNTADQTITGFAFNNASVRSFRAQVSILVDATTDLFAVYELSGIQTSASWAMSESFTGDSIPSFTFTITTTGQVRATIGNITGFTSATIKFRAEVTNV